METVRPDCRVHCGASLERGGAWARKALRKVYATTGLGDVRSAGPCSVTGAKISPAAYATFFTMSRRGHGKNPTITG